MFMAISWNDIGTDEDLAREVLVVARDIAPCIFTFADDSEGKNDALAVLRRVYKHIAGRGAEYVKSQRVGPSAVEYREINSAFDGQPRRALRALCTSTSAAGHSVGSFPTERPIGRLWPERY